MGWSMVKKVVVDLGRPVQFYADHSKWPAELAADLFCSTLTVLKVWGDQGAPTACSKGDVTHIFK